MRQRMLILGVLTFFCSFVPAMAAEFQPMGALGIGGAGVARVRDGFAPYWNPAGLAFHDKIVSTRINGGGGVSLHNNLADNVEKLSEIDFDALSAIASNNSLATVAQFGEAVKLVAILEDIDRKEGAIRVHGNAVFGNQIQRFGFGVYGTTELSAIPAVDTDNVLLGNSAGLSEARADLAAATSGSTTSNGYFTTSQRATIDAALSSGGFTDATQRSNIINAAEAQLVTSGISSDSAATALAKMGVAFSGGTGGIDNNQSSVVGMGLGYLEVPISYGHPIDLGSLGKLGIGGSIKAIRGRVYTSTVTIFNSDSGEIVDEIRDSYKDTTALGIDAGALWRLSDAMSVGVVVKNINGPEFDTRYGGKVKLKPQARGGFAWDPAPWITLAADLDLTENETMLPDYKSRNFGGGFELHPVTWFKLRGGAYQNTAEDDIGAVATAGLTLGTKWVNFDFDGAYGLEQGTLEGEKFPKEARGQINLNILF